MKITSIVIGIILIVAVGGFVYSQNRDTDTTPLPNTENTDSNSNGSTNTETSPIKPSANTGGTTGSTNTGGTTTEKPSSITMAEIAKHNSRISCWVTINGGVYDLTSWIPKHPGGEEAILKLCGGDGSKKFNDKHGGAIQQVTVLAGFKIGTLAQ